MMKGTLVDCRTWMLQRGDLCNLHRLMEEGAANLREERGSLKRPERA
jgi:hypothetical protein